MIAFCPQYIRTVTMCIHISSSCNLNCKYCFKKNINSELNFDDVVRFIDCITQFYPHADRYIVDMSGAGEPLLRKELLFKIAHYCKELSNKYMREFLPTLVTNGTLLSESTVSELQDAGVLFGVSIDGTREIHNQNRVFLDGSGSYDIIENNVKSIESSKYVGVALTYSDGRLLESFLNAFKLLPTVSMKPVRYKSEAPIDAKDICIGYGELVDYLLDKSLNSETEYIYALINGDDYFGKFLRRVVLNINIYGRCDAGIGRFALAGNRKIYCCPAAVGIEDGLMGDLDCGIRQSKIDLMWRHQQNIKCDGCYAHGVCGGECKIVSYNRFGNFDDVDDNMCKIKRHIYKLAFKFNDTIRNENSNVHKWLFDKCNDIENYYTCDEKLIEAVNLSKGKYTFTDLKHIKDSNIQQFEAIYTELIKSNT